MKKPSDMTSKICRDLQANGFIGLAFVGDNKTNLGSFVIKTDEGANALFMLTECVKEVAKTAELSPWHVMDVLGHMLGEYPPPADISPQLKEFADIAKAFYEHEQCYEHEHRYH